MRASISSVVPVLRLNHIEQDVVDVADLLRVLRDVARVLRYDPGQSVKIFLYLLLPHSKFADLPVCLLTLFHKSFFNTLHARVEVCLILQQEFDSPFHLFAGHVARRLRAAPLYTKVCAPDESLFEGDSSGARWRMMAARGV